MGGWGSGARGAYDAFARAYDAYTADYEYDRWIAKVLGIAGELGLQRREVLDAGCGTANSTLPLIARGLDVSACDLSPAMVAEARRKLPDRRRVGLADMRELALEERFDLVTCLDDGVNYLLGERDLRAGVGGLARSLRPAGCWCSTSTRSAPCAPPTAACTTTRPATGGSAGPATARPPRRAAASRPAR
jgi:SAM-dependent methyltransferase